MQRYIYRIIHSSRVIVVNKLGTYVASIDSSSALLLEKKNVCLELFKIVGNKNNKVSKICNPFDKFVSV